MKRVLVVALALTSLTQVVNAQKGSILVGGDVNLTTVKSPSTPNDTKETSFSFNPTVGYQFNENWTAGIIAEIGSDKYTNSTNIDTKNSTFGIGPFVRYSKTLSNIFSVYGQLQGVFGTDKTNKTKTGSFTDVSAFPAVFVNVKNGFGLNFNFGGLEFASTKPTGSSATNGFGLTFGKTVNIGVSKNFSCHKRK